MKERSVTGPPKALTAKYSYREVHVEWGLHPYLMMNLKHREPFQTPYYRDAVANEIEVNIPSPLRFFCFRQKLMRLFTSCLGPRCFASVHPLSVRVMHILATTVEIGRFILSAGRKPTKFKSARLP